MTPRAHQLTGLLTLSLFTAAAGCYSLSGGEDKPDPESRIGRAAGHLKQAESCEDLLAEIQADAIAKLDAQVEALKRDAREFSESFETDGEPGDPGEPEMVYDAGVSIDLGGAGTGDQWFAPSGTAGEGGWDGDLRLQYQTSAGNANTGAGPEGYSRTNVQVAEVDEADIVKFDGDNLYLLHGSELYVVGAWPPSDLALGPGASIEGEPVEMFVSEGRAAIFSRVYDSGALGVDPMIGAAAEKYGEDAMYGVDYGYGVQITKITLVDVGGEMPVVARELYLEGDYRSARLYDSLARVVVQGGFRAPDLYNPELQYLDPFGRPVALEWIEAQIDDWRERTVEAVRSTELSDWLPAQKERIDGELVQVERRCTDYYAPAPGTTGYGLTSVVALNIAEDRAPLSGASVLGQVSEVYSSRQALLLAHPEWFYDSRGYDEQERTSLHSFSLDGTRTVYQASGYVPGHILDQFSMDVDDVSGIIRLATTAESWGDSWEITNRVYTLQAEGNDLVVVGESEPLGHEGEEIFSARFVGSRGYLVTFRQTDPLIVVDLSDPATPIVLGEVEIPGFSDYMHPLDEGHLLTIGRNADQWGNELGLMLQIFDVSNPARPRRTHLYEYAPDGYSAANHDHKAFTYWAEKRLLAFPYVDYARDARSTLEVFRVSIDTGFEPLGAVDHTELMLQNGCLVQDPWDDYVYYECPQAEVRRGVFADDYVYTISFGGVSVHALDDLRNAVAEVMLPPVYGYGYYPPPAVWNPAIDAGMPLPIMPFDAGVDDGGAGWTDGWKDAGWDSGSDWPVDAGVDSGNDVPLDAGVDASAL